LKFPFNSTDGLIYIQAEVSGTSDAYTIRMVLDTGASRTILREGVLEHLGYTPKTAIRKINITTGSRVEPGVKLSVKKISALGRVRKNISVVTYSLATELKLDGILGLDFFRGRKLIIDFREGLISLK